MGVQVYLDSCSARVVSRCSTEPHGQPLAKSACQSTQLWSTNPVDKVYDVYAMRCKPASRLHRLDTDSGPGYLLDRYKGLGRVLRPRACCCATNDAIIRESRICNGAREVVISISANAEALCCSIARERLVYNNMQDLNKEDAATHIRHPLPSMLLEERIPRLAVRVFGYQSRCRAHQSKSQTTQVRHPTKAVPAPNEFSLQMSVYYKQVNPSYFIFSLCILLCRESQILNISASWALPVRTKS